MMYVQNLLFHGGHDMVHVGERLQRDMSDGEEWMELLVHMYVQAAL